MRNGLTALAICVLLGACAGGNSPQVAPGAGEPAPLPALPPVAELPLRQTSVPLGHTRLGAQFELSSSLAQAEGSIAAFTPDFGADLASSAWAIYQLDLSDYTGLPQLQFFWEQAPTTGFWIGLADFTSGRWRFASPADPAQVGLGELDDFIAEDGTVFLALIFCSSEEPRLLALQFGSSADPVPAIHLEETEVLAPQLLTLDASASFSPAGEIVTYRWDIDGEPGFEEETGITPEIIILLDRLPGTYPVAVQIADDQGREAEATIFVTVTGIQFATPPTETFVDNVPEADVDTKWLYNCYAPLPPWDDDNRAFQNVYFLTEAAKLIDLINAERAALSRPALTWDVHLELAAQAHSRHMALLPFFDHVNPYGQDTWGRYALISGLEFGSAAENIFAGSIDAAGTWQQLLDSEDHYDNVVNPDLTHIGMGVYHSLDSPYGTYWTMLMTQWFSDPNAHDWVEPQEIN